MLVRINAYIIEYIKIVLPNSIIKKFEDEYIMAVDHTLLAGYSLNIVYIKQENRAYIMFDDTVIGRIL